MKLRNSQNLRREYPPNNGLMKNNSPPEGKHPPITSITTDKSFR